MDVTCLSVNGNIWAFGSNQYGQLGVGNAVQSTVTDPQRLNDFEGRQNTIAVAIYVSVLAIEIDCGASHSLGRTSAGEIYTWGSNYDGQLGHPQGHMRHLCDRDEWMFIVELFRPSQERTPQLVRALRGIQIQSLAAGHVCSGAIDVDGHVYTWGSNRMWQLGRPSDYHTSPKPDRVFVFNTEYSLYHVSYIWMAKDVSPLTNIEYRIHSLVLTVLALDFFYFKDTRAVQVPHLTNARQLLFGGCHAMCLTDFEGVWVWGTNENGCLGLGPKPRYRTEFSYLTNNLPLPTKPENHQGDAFIEAVVRSPMRLEETKLIQGSLGWKHSGGVTPLGELLVWGWGGSVGEATYLFEGGIGSGGQLGHGSDYDAWYPSAVRSPSIPDGSLKFIQISCGLNHTAAVAEMNKSRHVLHSADNVHQRF